MNSTRPTASLAILLLLGAVQPTQILFAQTNTGAYADAVMSLSSTGVIDGGGNVRLDEYVNRAEALKIILRSNATYAAEADRIRNILPPISLFPDVSQQQWYAPYIEVGFRHGLVKGYPDGRFAPEGGVKVAEAAAMLARLYGEQTTTAPYMSSSDFYNEPDQWYTGAASVMIQRGAVMPGSALIPGNFMKRGQLMDMTYRMREVHSRGVQSFADVGGSSVLSVVSGGTNGVVPPVAIPSVSIAQYASKKPFAITIPSIGIVDLSVSHPADPYTQKGVLEPLQTGVGHLFSYPGKGGRVMIYGHSSGYPWDLSKFTKIFRTINEVQVGDKIYLTHEGTLHVYQVSATTTISASDQSIFASEDDNEELILYTCWPPDSITNRFLVHAVPIDVVALR